jgi:hypothetical protein
MDRVERARAVSIAALLEAAGHELRAVGTVLMCRSPLSLDKTPSFCIFPENRFRCFSSGEKGDVIDLFMKLKGCDFPAALEGLLDPAAGLAEAAPRPIVSARPRPVFRPAEHLWASPSEKVAIGAYAASRGLSMGYREAHVRVWTQDTGWWRTPALGFVHRNATGQVCGVKLRSTDPGFPGRYRMRGEAGLFGLAHVLREAPVLFVVESEINACSLFQVLHGLCLSFVVVSSGSVSTLPALEGWLLDLEGYLLIDYDGDSRAWAERCARYAPLGLVPLLLPLPKGEDLNTLLCQGLLLEALAEAENSPLKKKHYEHINTLNTQRRQPG